jgi:hypothetical protein
MPRKRLHWITNISDPRLPDAKKKVTRILGETLAEAWKNQKADLADKTLGEPRATPFHSQEELIEMGIVGVYGA